MPGVATLLAAALTARGLAHAAPRFGSVDTGTNADTGTTSLVQVRNPNFVFHGSLAMAKIYRKYGKPLPPDLEAAVSRFHAEHKRTTGHAVNKPRETDIEWLTPITVGTPPQQLNIDIDTGSSDFWVFCSETPKSELNGQTIYDPSASSTSTRLDGATWKITYGDGSGSSGDVYLDIVNLGGLQVNQQAVECAQQVSAQFTSDVGNDGLLGLGYGMLNTVKPDKQKTLMDNAIPSLDEPLFTADLKHGVRKCNRFAHLVFGLTLVCLAGSYNFGFIDDNLYQGDLTYTPVDTRSGFWMITSSGYQVGSDSFEERSYKGIVDTGASILLMPEWLTNNYYSGIDGAKYDKIHGAWTLDCSSSPPDLTIGVEGGLGIQIPGNYMLYERHGNATENRCFGGIQLDTGIGFSVFGDIAIKSAFVVFDQGNNQVGIASKALN